MFFNVNTLVQLKRLSTFLVSFDLEWRRAAVFEQQLEDFPTAYDPDHGHWQFTVYFYGQDHFRIRDSSLTRVIDEAYKIFILRQYDSLKEKDKLNIKAFLQTKDEGRNIENINYIDVPIHDLPYHFHHFWSVRDYILDADKADDYLDEDEDEDNLP